MPLDPPDPQATCCYARFPNWGMMAPVVIFWLTPRPLLVMGLKKISCRACVLFYGLLVAKNVGF